MSTEISPLQPRDIQWLRHLDGLADPHELHTLGMRTEELAAELDFFEHLRNHLQPEPVSCLADHILKRLELVDTLAGTLGSLLRPSETPDLVQGVLSRLGLDEPTLPIVPGALPDESAFVQGVFQRLGLPAPSSTLRNLLSAPDQVDLAEVVLATCVPGASRTEIGRASLAAPNSPELWADISTALDLPVQATLLPEAPIDTGSLADSILQALGLPHTALLPLGPPEVPELSTDVLNALGLSDERPNLGPNETPELFTTIATELGLELTSQRVIEGELRGPPVGELADAVLGGLSKADPTRTLVQDLLQDPLPSDSSALPLANERAPLPFETPANAEPQEAAQPRSPFLRTLRRLGPALAMAAAALLSVFWPEIWGTADTQGHFTYELTAANRVEIEELSADSDTIVSVIPSEEDAPTIIFIDMAAEEDEVPSPAVEG
jgi:hypothetical protein